MKIAIIVHSYTGNTLAVAQKIQDRLVQAGHLAEIEQIKIKGGEQPNNPSFTIDNPLIPGGYDSYIFGAPVRGFSISPVISAYLNQISSLKDQKVACFVTKQLNSNWTGGNRAITSMKNICESKGGIVVTTGIVFSKSKNRDAMIGELADRICGLI